MITEWSRARLQRQELGPIVHDLGHEIYDKAEARIEAGAPLTCPTDLPSLATFASSCLRAVEAVKTMGDLRDSRFRYETAKSVITSNRGYSTDLEGNPFDYEITHYEGLYNVMNEGLTSGVVVPLQLYRLIKLRDHPSSVRQHSKPPDVRATKEDLQVDAQDVIDQLSSDYFQRMLHQLAVGNNGSLGRASTAISNLSSPDVSQARVFNVVGLVGLPKSFEYDKDGSVIGWSKVCLDEIKALKVAARSSKRSLEKESGGCPVRHTTFPVLGEIASRHFEEIGTPDGQPRNQGESLISRGTRYVRTILAATIEKGEE